MVIWIYIYEDISTELLELSGDLNISPYIYMYIWICIYKDISTELLELSSDLIYIYEEISVEILEYIYIHWNICKYISTHMRNEDASQEGRVLLQIGHRDWHII